MNYKKLATIILVMIPICLQAQTKYLCITIKNLIIDAPSGFKFFRGEMISAKGSYPEVYECKANLSNVIEGTGRIIYFLSDYYRGALYQTKDTAALKTAYEGYGTQLDDCMVAMGYERSASIDNSRSMAAYGELLYVKKNPDKEPRAPNIPKVRLDVDSSNSGIYTILLYVFSY